VNDWTPTDFDTYDNAKLNIYTNCDEVELFLNGKSQGKKPKNANDAPVDWELSFEKGTIEVVGINKGIVASREILKTAGKPAKLQIQLSKSSIKNHWDDVVMARIQVLDEAGLPCPNADNLIQFDISGNGQIAGLDNGDINSHESYQGKQRTSYKGKTLVILKATADKGTIGLTVSSNGLVTASTSITIN
jgi:beta-galactosidase